MKWKKPVARIIGNFGVSFFSPLVGTNLILDTALIESVLVGVISSAIVTGVTISRELAVYGSIENGENPTF